MSARNRTKHILGLLLFFTGYLSGAAFWTAAVWAGLEASLFDAAIRGEAPLRSLRCPLVITTSETGIVSATLSNPTDRPRIRTVRIRVSFGYVTLLREVETRLELQPGESQYLEWEVTPEDAAWGRFILLRVHVLRTSPLPSHATSCGIVVLNLPQFSGNQIVTFTLATSLLGMGLGLALWRSANRPLRGRKFYAGRIMATLAAMVVAGLILSLLRWWAVGGLLLMLMLLISVSALAWAARASE